MGGGVLDAVKLGSLLILSLRDVFIVIQLIVLVHCPFFNWTLFSRIRDYKILRNTNKQISYSNHTP